jgi:hydroxypyruvate reductase
MGDRVARRLVAFRHAGTVARPSVLVWSGETTVRLPPDGRHGVGGRSQELALSAAMRLGNVGALAQGIALLAAGTDGRDGPTDAAGAIVDGETWRRMFDAGRVPNFDLAAHDSHGALGAVGALIPARHTGANVADVCIGLVAPP